jgi:hypothetical protein
LEGVGNECNTYFYFGIGRSESQVKSHLDVWRFRQNRQNHLSHRDAILSGQASPVSASTSANGNSFTNRHRRARQRHHSSAQRARRSDRRMAATPTTIFITERGCPRANTGEPMESDILSIINEGMNPGLLMLIKSIVLITVVLAIVVVPTYLAGIAWLCFLEMRRPLHRQRNLVSGQPNPDDLELLTVLTELEESPADDVATDFTSINQTFPSSRWKPSLRQVSGVSQ